MELSLQKKVNLQQFYNLRATVIKELSLHIEDSITYSEFQEIYNTFGKGYDEETFARYCLDIGKTKLYNLSSGKTKKTPILTKEYVSLDEIEDIRKAVLARVSELKLESINYDTLLEFHKNYGGRLSLKFFAEEFLDVKPHSVDCLKSYDEPCKILKGKNYDVELVRKIKEKVVKSSKLHIGDEITLHQFRQIYEKYGQDIDEKIFAIKVLEISQNQVTKFLKGNNKKDNDNNKKAKEAKAIVFSNYIVNPEEIYALREKVIQKEHLHIDDLIDNKRFLELYEKYAGILDRETFAEEILDISSVGVKNMRVEGSNSLLLGDIDVSKEYILFLRDKIIKKENLAECQILKREQFFEYYQKYAGVLSGKQFALDVLKVSPDDVSKFLTGEKKTTAILSGEKITDFEALRKKVIEENFLHYDDKMNYHQFKAIYDKYGGNIPETIFAEKILDIGSVAYGNITRAPKGKYNTFILSKEKLPTDIEFEVLKRKVLLENKLHLRDSIKFDKFHEIHIKYGGIVPDYIFADKIFGIRKEKLSKMIRDHEEEAIILPASKVPIKELKSLRRKVKKDNNLVPRKEISLANFEDWYSNYEHILTRTMFARGVLGVNRDSLEKISHRNVLAYQAKEKLESLYWVDTKEDLLENYYFVMTIEKKAKKIIADYLYTPKNVEKIKIYLQKCADDAKAKTRNFSKKDILFLDECVDFTVGGIKEISNFVRIAAASGEYEIARRCISKNIDNEGITSEQKNKLSAMRSQLIKSSKRKIAAEMVFNNDNTSEIMARTGLSETEISKIKRKIHGNVSSKTEELPSRYLR